MATARDIYDFIDEIAPFNTQCDWDNAGLLVGSYGAAVSKICVCLDITNGAVEFAKQNGCELIVSHHPVIFNPAKSVPENTPVYNLCRENITAICAHTNLDCAAGGVNDTLAKTLGLSDIIAFDLSENIKNPLARIGVLPKEIPCGEFAKLVCRKLGCSGLKYTESKRSVKTVAVCGGAGSEYMESAIRLGADALVTSDTRHHELLAANAADFCLVDAGHYCTENPVAAVLAEKISDKFPGISVFVYSGYEPAKFTVKE
ncbi:MAG: Nif3-like dinuclear metal center hexameric protein [Acutalibacteraceae bacterium]